MKIKGINKQKQAISLIVLIITIIVMIVLAGAVIISLSNNGIIDRANDAVEKTNLKQVQTIAETLWAQGKLEGESPETIKSNIIAAIGGENVAAKYNINVTDTGVTVELVHNSGNSNEDELIVDAVGVMSADNTITLKGTLLTSGDYTLKYENESGIMNDYANICTLHITEAKNDVVYDGFIPENCAPQGAKKIGVYNSSGDRVGSIGLSSTFKKNLGNKLYSFGAISDTHIGYNTAESDLINALTYFENDSSIEFIVNTVFNFQEFGVCACFGYFSVLNHYEFVSIAES